MNETGKSETGAQELAEQWELEPPVSKKVVLLNDNVTTKSFVVSVLMFIFHKNTEQATAIMERVHSEGRGVVGEYPYDIAATRCMQVRQTARNNGFPLRCVLE